MAKNAAFEQGLLIGMQIGGRNGDDQSENNTIDGGLIFNGSRGLYPLRFKNGGWYSHPCPSSAVYNVLNGSLLDAITMGLSASKMGKSFVAGNDGVKADYIRSNAKGKLIASYSNSVADTPIPPPPYQSWGGGYQDSPVLTTDYPYQAIGSFSDGYTYLFLSKSPIYKNASGDFTCDGGGSGGVFKYSYTTTASPGAWPTPIERWGLSGGVSVIKANNPIYTDSSKTVVFFAKNTFGSSVVTNGLLTRLESADFPNGTTFDGVDDRLITGSISLSGQVPMTLGLRCKLISNASGDDVIAVCGNFELNYQLIGLYARSSRPNFRITWWSTDYETGFAKDDLVHDWSIVYDGSKITVYRDGVVDPAGSATIGISFANTKLSLGAGSTGTYSNVQIQRALVYNRALTLAEITQNSNASI